MKKLIALVLALAMCLCFTGCGESLSQMGQIMGDAMDSVQRPNQEKTFTKGGVTMTLTTSFLDFTETDKNTADYTFVYASDSIGLLCVEEDKQQLFSQFDEMDLQGYALLIAQLYSLDTEPEQRDGLWTFTYENTVEEQAYTYRCTFFETDGSFWNIQSYTNTADFAANDAVMWKYVTSATFSEN